MSDRKLENDVQEQLESIWKVQGDPVLARAVEIGKYLDEKYPGEREKVVFDRTLSEVSPAVMRHFSKDEAAKAVGTGTPKPVAYQKLPRRVSFLWRIFRAVWRWWNGLERFADLEASELFGLSEPNAPVVFEKAPFMTYGKPIGTPIYDVNGLYASDSRMHAEPLGKLLKNHGLIDGEFRADIAIYPKHVEKVRAIIERVNAKIAAAKAKRDNPPTRDEVLKEMATKLTNARSWMSDEQNMGYGRGGCVAFEFYEAIKRTAAAIGVPVETLLAKMKELRRQRWLRGEQTQEEREFYGDNFEQEKEHGQSAIQS